jgi:3-oxoacyl-[acyl-carrier-protein] synthase II
MKKSTVEKRVVITGLGVISSIGIGWQEFWKNLLAGKSGISKISSFDTSNYDRTYAGEITNFSPEEFISFKKARQLGRASQLAIAVSKLALKDAEFNQNDITEASCGVCIGTTMGEPQVMETLDAKHFPGKDLQIDFASALSYPASCLSNNVANYLKFKSPNFVFSNACAAGNYAVGYAYDMIRTGAVDYMLAGGVDAFSRIAFTGFSRLFAVAPEKCQPFDKNRKGMIPGEGAGMVFMESLASAHKRNAPIYAEITGFGMSCDARHMTAPDPAGAAKAMRKALQSAGIGPEKIDYISAHGTGTKENDKAECQAVHKVFGKRASRIPMSSIKSMLGHTMGAAAALETIACCLAIKDQCVPPTINLEEKDPGCDIDCIPNENRECDLRTVLNNSQAFGGNNADLLFKKI